MPKMTEYPDSLKPYVFHGVNLNWKDGMDDAMGDCPWCGRENKFSVNVATSKWRCFVCNEGADTGKPIRGGNSAWFIKKLWEISFAATKPEEYEELAHSRKLLSAQTLISWQVCRNVLNGLWMVPGFNLEYSLVNLYRYSRFQDKYRLLPTPTLGHHIFGLNLAPKEFDTVDVFEGPWDAMAYWELCGQSKRSTDRLVLTGNQSSSLLRNRLVIALPGCNVFYDAWLPLFHGRTVNIWFDNDHERIHPKLGTVISPGGLDGVKRLASTMTGSKYPPTAVYYCKWGSEGDQWNRDLPSGYDVRDFLTEE